MKNKIVESMAWGCPVVATNVGAEGMGLESKRDILIADDPDEFAEKVVSVYSRGEKWDNISKNGYSAVKEKYSIRKMQGRILEIV